MHWKCVFDPCKSIFLWFPDLLLLFESNFLPSWEYLLYEISRHHRPNVTQRQRDGDSKYSEWTCTLQDKENIFEERYNIIHIHILTFFIFDNKLSGSSIIYTATKYKISFSMIWLKAFKTKKSLVQWLIFGLDKLLAYARVRIDANLVTCASKNYSKILCNVLLWGHKFGSGDCILNIIL